MATRNKNAPLAQVLDQRIRAIVDEALESAIRETLRTVIQEELAVALGTEAAAGVSTTAGRRRGRPAGKASAKARAAKGAKRTTARTSKRKCNVVGCKRPHRSMGYCAAHYQSARKHGWPMPAPEGFVAPPPAPRGRPPKKSRAAAEE
ncbi:MAG TPA: hypothetical protein VN033_09925 [Vulgatibacter sp.]|nr:hypothetical protein [Vulgatibacter sp.]